MFSGIRPPWQHSGGTNLRFSSTSPSSLHLPKGQDDAGSGGCSLQVAHTGAAMCSHPTATVGFTVYFLSELPDHILKVYKNIFLFSSLKKWFLYSLLQGMKENVFEEMA